MQSDHEQGPPPPQQQDSMFSEGTREYYAKEIRSGATRALIFGILSVFCCPPVFAYFGYTTAQEVIANIEIYEVEQGKKGLAEAAKVLSIVGIALWAVGFVLRIATASM